MRSVDVPPTHQIRADYDADTIVVYQAYGAEIALPAVEAGRFVAPFSLHRMTWIKPSFLWLMERSNWGRKAQQQHILAVRITRAGWEEALSQAVLTHPERGVYRDAEEWRRQFDASVVHVQWDPERSMRGAALAHRSIQVGLSRHVIRRYVEEWTVSITELTARVRQLDALIRAGDAARAAARLPRERPYPLPAEIGRKITLSPEEWLR